MLLLYDWDEVKDLCSWKPQQRDQKRGGINESPPKSLTHSRTTPAISSHHTPPNLLEPLT